MDRTDPGRNGFSFSILNFHGHCVYLASSHLSDSYIHPALYFDVMAHRDELEPDDSFLFPVLVYGLVEIQRDSIVLSWIDERITRRIIS